MNGDGLRFDTERIRNLTRGLTDADVDRVLICLKSKQIDEQIRSNQVIEGVLFDIHVAVQIIADKELKMNGENETKVKQTANEQSEKISEIIEKGIEKIENDPEFLIKALDSVKERDEKINQCLGDLASLINCDHAGLKGEHAAIVDRIKQTDVRVQRIEVLVNSTESRLKDLVGDVEPPAGKKPQSLTDTADMPPAEQPTGKAIVKPGPFGPAIKDKPSEKPGSGVVSEKDSQGGKGDAGIVSEKDEQPGKEGSGL